MVNRRWVSWNMRGLGGAEKRRAVREAIKSFNPDITLLHETKLDANKAKVIQDFSLSLERCCRRSSNYVETCLIFYHFCNKGRKISRSDVVFHS